jgi:hypothetical protein
MNAAMNINGQHEIHPDAETLSAFTEQALNAKERDEVLVHLAVCSRCRQVVALAREVVGAEVLAGRHEAARPKAWWRSWGFTVVPVAAMAATALIAFYVHERAIVRTAEVAKLEQQQPNEKAAMPPQTPEQPPAQAAPPAPATPVDVHASPGAQAKPEAPTKPRETERPSEATRKPVTDPDETAVAPPPEAANEPASEREEYRRSPAAEIHGAMANAHDPTRALADGETPSEAAMNHEERKKQAEEMAEERHQVAAKAATPSSPHDSEVDKTRTDKTGIDNAGGAPAESRTAASSEQVEVDAQQQLEAQPAPDVIAGSLMRMRSGAFSPSLMPRPIHLPSRLPALSIVSSDHRVLAIDKKGALFFSDDSGFTWKKVKRQWTGRAIFVRRKTAEDATPPAPTAPESAGNTSATDALSHPETVFELVNDQSGLWLSADGRIWTAK